MCKAYRRRNRRKYDDNGRVSLDRGTITTQFQEEKKLAECFRARYGWVTFGTFFLLLLRLVVAFFQIVRGRFGCEVYFPGSWKLYRKPDVLEIGIYTMNSSYSRVRNLSSGSHMLCRTVESGSTHADLRTAELRIGRFSSAFTVVTLSC